MRTEGKIEKISFRKAIEFPSTTYATFGLYRYPAKFIPHVIAYTLKNYATPGMKVFDPFAGYGTVGVVSRIYGHDYEMWDLNPMLKVLHSVAIMKPMEIDVKNTLQQMTSSKKKFIPDWTRMNYWFSEEILLFLHRVWGYYHSLPDNSLKLLLTVPLLKTTRYFSYDDMQRQKLSRSQKSKKRVDSLLSCDWEKKFFQMLEREIDKVMNGLREYKTFSPKNTKGTIRAGIDAMEEKLKQERDILITSPPYLQSQEYIRQAKLDLFWLGHSEEEIKKLGKLEIPYRDIEPCPIHSETFSHYRSGIEEQHIGRIFDRYFWGILGCLTRLQEKISSYLFLFVGHSSAHGRAIPIDKIFAEHFSELGWKHELTLMDTIVSRRLFAYKVNPASGIKDMRTPVENLVILKRH